MDGKKQDMLNELANKARLVTINRRTGEKPIVIEYLAGSAHGFSQALIWSGIATERECQAAMDKGK